MKTTLLLLALGTIVYSIAKQLSCSPPKRVRPRPERRKCVFGIEGCAICRKPS